MRTVLQGAGLGLRRSLLRPLLKQRPTQLDFLEIAPENWIGVGGRWGRELTELAEHYPIALHGLSLNLGGTAPLNEELLRSVSRFMRQHQCPVYSEHLSACADQGYLYDLMPLPFTEEMVRHVAGRVRQVQEVLGCRIALENASYYTPLSTELTEAQFIGAVLEEADCDLLLDVNNVVVNAVNHGYDAQQFLQQMPMARIRYLHVAGHLQQQPDLLIDTHGTAVADPVWALLTQLYRDAGALPTLLERDFNLPALESLLDEVAQIRSRQQAADEGGGYGG